MDFEEYMSEVEGSKKGNGTVESKTEGEGDDEDDKNGISEDSGSKDGSSDAGDVEYLQLAWENLEVARTICDKWEFHSFSIAIH